jgi:hypothetical protein
MATYNDGAIPYGINVCTINSIAYEVEDLQIAVNGDQIERRNGFNVLTGRVIIDPNNITGTMRLQRATTATAFPPIGSLFTFPNNLALTGQGYVMSGGQSYNQAAAHVFEVAVGKRINT